MSFMEKFGSIVYNALQGVYKVIPKKGFANIPDLQKFCADQIKAVREEPLLRFGKDWHKEITSLIEKWSKLPEDERALKILKYVHNTIAYKQDSVAWRLPDYWQTFQQTFSKKTGDCEDGALMIFVLSRLAGIPANRICVRCGWVSMTTGHTGHAYAVYRASNGWEYPLDWCFKYSSGSFNERVPFGLMGLPQNGYLDFWFSFNDEGIRGEIDRKYFAKM